MRGRRASGSKWTMRTWSAIPSTSQPASEGGYAWRTCVNSWTTIPKSSGCAFTNGPEIVIVDPEANATPSISRLKTRSTVFAGGGAPSLASNRSMVGYQRSHSSFASRPHASSSGTSLVSTRMRGMTSARAIRCGGIDHDFAEGQGVRPDFRWPGCGPPRPSGRHPCAPLPLRRGRKTPKVSPSSEISSTHPDRGDPSRPPSP